MSRKEAEIDHIRDLLEGEKIETVSHADEKYSSRKLVLELEGGKEVQVFADYDLTLHVSSQNNENSND